MTLAMVINWLKPSTDFKMFPEISFLFLKNA